MALPFSTNPMIMAENIRKLEGIEADVPVDKIPKDYSSTEVNTGLKWTDDKPIYKITLTGKTPTEVNAVINDFAFDNIISIEGIVLSTAGDYYDFNKNVTLTGNKANNRLIIVLPAANYRDTDYIVTILYTKPAASLSLNRELKVESEPDSVKELEPEIKKVTRKKTTTKEEE